MGEITAKDTRAAGIPWVFSPNVEVAAQALWSRSLFYFFSSCFIFFFAYNIFFQTMKLLVKTHTLIQSWQRP